MPLYDPLAQFSTASRPDLVSWHLDGAAESGVAPGWTTGGLFIGPQQPGEPNTLGQANARVEVAAGRFLQGLKSVHASYGHAWMLLDGLLRENSFAVNLWVQKDSAWAGGATTPLLRAFEGRGHNSLEVRVGATLSVEYGHRQGAGAALYQTTLNHDASAWLAGEWHNVHLALSGGTFRVWIDGVLRHTAAGVPAMRHWSNGGYGDGLQLCGAAGTGAVGYVLSDLILFDRPVVPGEELPGTRTDRITVSAGTLNGATWRRDRGAYLHAVEDWRASLDYATTYGAAPLNCAYARGRVLQDVEGSLARHDKHLSAVQQSDTEIVGTTTWQSPLSGKHYNMRVVDHDLANVAACGAELQLCLDSNSVRFGGAWGPVPSAQSPHTHAGFTPYNTSVPNSLSGYAEFAEDLVYYVRTVKGRTLRYVTFGNECRTVSAGVAVPNGGFLNGTLAQFYSWRLEVRNRLKARWPDLQFGSPEDAEFNDVLLADHLDRIQSGGGPDDVFVWHSYSGDLAELWVAKEKLTAACAARGLAVPKVALGEHSWNSNYLRDGGQPPFSAAGQSPYLGAWGACFAAAAYTEATLLGYEYLNQSHHLWPHPELGDPEGINPYQSMAVVRPDRVYARHNALALCAQMRPQGVTHTADLRAGVKTAWSRSPSGKIVTGLAWFLRYRRGVAAALAVRVPGWARLRVRWRLVDDLRANPYDQEVAAQPIDDTCPVRGTAWVEGDTYTLPETLRAQGVLWIEAAEAPARPVLRTVPGDGLVALEAQGAGDLGREWAFYRDGAEIGRRRFPYLVDVGAVNGVSHSYTVRALTAEGVESELSLPVTAAATASPAAWAPRKWTPAGAALASPTGATPRLGWTPQLQRRWQDQRDANSQEWQWLADAAAREGTPFEDFGSNYRHSLLMWQITGDVAWANKAKAWPLYWGTPENGALPNPWNGGNTLREDGQELITFVDWLWPALSAADRAACLAGVEHWVAIITGRDEYVYGIRTNDTDDSSALYYVLVSACLAFHDRTDAADWASRAYNVASGYLVGGPFGTRGTLPDTLLGLSLRDMITGIMVIAGWSLGSVSDEWMEAGGGYNLGTLKTLYMGWFGALTATRLLASDGATYLDCWPEVSEQADPLWLGIIQSVTPDLRTQHRWGDVEGNGIEEQEQLPMSALKPLLQMGTGLCSAAGLNAAGQSLRLLLDLQAQYPGETWLFRSMTRGFWHGNLALTPAADRSGLPLAAHHIGQGVHLRRTGWGANGRLFAAHLLPEHPFYDHRPWTFGTVWLYRRGRWVHGHPLDYAGEALYGSGANNPLFAGLPPVRGRRAHRHHAAASPQGDWLYVSGTHWRNYLAPESYQPPPHFASEATRSMVVLMDGDGLADSVIVLDRHEVLAPEDLRRVMSYGDTERHALYDRYGRTTIQWWARHGNTVPVDTGNGWSWDHARAGGGTQRARVWHLRGGVARTMSDRGALGYRLRLRGTEADWELFLHALDAHDAAATLLYTPVESSTGALFGALRQRTDAAGKPLDLVLGNGVRGRVQLRRASGTVTWSGIAAGTRVILTGLDPAGTWTAAVDGGAAAPLAVSAQGTAELFVAGAGTHTLALAVTGVADTRDAETAAPRTVSGTVRDGANNPIAGALVQVGPSVTALSAADGAWSAEFVPAGEALTVIARKAGWKFTGAVVNAASGNVAGVALVGSAYVPGVTTGYLVNAGGPAAEGYLADQAWTAGAWGRLGGATWDWGSGSQPGRTLVYATDGCFHYLFDLPAGTYPVTIRAREDDPLMAAGDRRMDVWANGDRVLAGFDARALAGGLGLVGSAAFNVTTDGTQPLLLTFRGTDGILGAVEIGAGGSGGGAPPPPPSGDPVYVNCGGLQHVFEGRTYAADAHSLNGAPYDWSGDINVADEPLWGTIRYNAPTQSYRVPVGGGTYRVRLRFCEGDTRVDAAGERINEIRINGVLKETLDLWTAGGNARGVPLTRTYEEITPLNGAIDIDITGTGVFATGYLNAFDIEPAGAAGQPPAAPTGLQAAAGNAQVALTWNASTGATSYTVKRSGTPGGPYSVVQAGLTGTSYTNTGLINGTPYYYVVTATNADGESGSSNEATATPQPPPPATPSGLAATPGDTQVGLAWNASSGAAGYRVRRSGVLVYDGAGTGFTDTGLTNGQSYSWTVSAYNAGGESGQSSPVSATPTWPTPAQPQGLAAVGGNAQITLSWQGASGAQRYRVYRDGVAVADTTPGALSFVDTGRVNGQTHTYRVSGLSPASPPAEGPQSAPAAGMATAEGGGGDGMAYQHVIALPAGPAYAGVTLRLDLHNTNGTLDDQPSSGVTTGFYEKLGTGGSPSGHFFWAGPIEDGWQGAAYIVNHATNEVLAVCSVNPRETEYADVPTSSRSTLTAAGVWAHTPRTLTALGAALVQEIWDRAVTALVTAGSIGKRIVDFLDAPVSSVGGGAVPPGICRISDTAFNGAGVAISGVKITVTAVNPPVVITGSGVVETTQRTVFSGTNGSWFIDCVQGKSYRFVIDSQDIDAVVVVPAAGAAILRELL